MTAPGETLLAAYQPAKVELSVQPFTLPLTASQSKL
jgi:hypothetical protein